MSLDFDQSLFRLHPVVMYQSNIDDGAELQNALFHQIWLALAANKQCNPKKQELNQLTMSWSMQLNRSALIFNPNFLSSSRMQVGLVTLISVM